MNSLGTSLIMLFLLCSSAQIFDLYCKLAEKIWCDYSLANLANQCYFAMQTLFAKTLKFLISVMAFKQICQTLLVQIDFLANLLNFSHAKLSLFTVFYVHVKDLCLKFDCFISVYSLVYRVAISKVLHIVQLYK